MLRKISEHVWYLPREDQNHRPALGYVCCGRESMIIDTGNSPDHLSLFYGNIRSRGLPDPQFAALTHWHWDHVFGLSGSPAKSIASSLTNEHLYDMNRLSWSDNDLTQRVTGGEELPEYAEIIQREIPTRHTFKVKVADMTFSSRCDIRLGEINCQLTMVGGPHSEDCVVVYIPQDHVLFAGDCYLPDSYHGRRMNITELKQLYACLSKFPADYVITAHEDDFTADDFFARMQQQIRIGDALAGIVEKEEGLRKLEQFFGRDLTETEQRIGESFILGNLDAFIRAS